MPDLVFQLRTHADGFLSRDCGSALREELLEFERTAPTETIIQIDAHGVDVMTPSFVDEFFGRTVAFFGIERFRSRFRIVGVASESMLLINKVVRNRLLLQSHANGGGAAEGA